MKTPYMRDVAVKDRIQFARLNSGMTQKELSARVGINPRNYSKYENGNSFPPPDVMVKLCRALDVTSDFILGLSDKYEPEKYGSDYVCLTGSDGSRRMYTIPDSVRDRVISVLKAGFPEIIKD